MRVKCAWENFYPNTQPDVIIKDGSRQVTKSEKNNYFVTFCLFQGLKVSSINFASTTDSTMFLTEDTLFSSCSSENFGGSIYYTYKGQFSQQRVCSYKSKTSNYGVFCYVDITDNYKNALFDSSISYSGDDTNTGNQNILLYGSANFSNINMSNAKVYGRCIFEILNINDKSTITYSTFSNNSQTRTDDYKYSASLYGSSSSIPVNIQFCNFLYNI